MMIWQKEDILEVLQWVEDASGEIRSIATEMEFIVISELFKRCAEEIRSLRSEVAELKTKKQRRRKP
jgi:hypothetical protein